MTFNDFFKKAAAAYHNFKGESVPSLGKAGEVVYSKNNVCIHTINTDGEQMHSPGYLSLSCQHCESLGVTLVLQWLPNTTLHNNPRSIRAVSPRRPGPLTPATPVADKGPPCEIVENDQTLTEHEINEKSELLDEHGNAVQVNEVERPTSFHFKESSVTVSDEAIQHPRSTSRPIPTITNTNLGAPEINLIPHTPCDAEALKRRFDEYVIEHPAQIQSDNITQTQESQESRRRSSSKVNPFENSKTPSTSSADEDEDDVVLVDEQLGLKQPQSVVTIIKERHRSLNSVPSTDDSPTRPNCLRTASMDYWSGSPEQFAQSHNLLLPDELKIESRTNDDGNGVAKLTLGGAAQFSKRDCVKPQTLFTVDLGAMRSLRVFYSNQPDCTSGQLVIASCQSQYKIFHFHCGGLDKLAAIFEQWSALRAKSFKEDCISSSPASAASLDRHFAVCQPTVDKSELDPEDGLYEPVNSEFWRGTLTETGQCQDSHMIRKATYFAGLHASVQREIWPFLLGVYSWDSTYEQRETIRNELFLEYQKIKKRNMRASTSGEVQAIEKMIVKDVVRTDRSNPFYAGDDNPNVEIMKNILVNFTVHRADIGYMQGMSDLLAPILCLMQQEAHAFWCFNGLDYLRELTRLMYPEFLTYLESLGSDGPQFLFTHRWILLLFKREFDQVDVIPLWEAIWTAYGTRFLHLFVCLAVIIIYGNDCLQQKLPLDEMLLYFASVANHMDATQVMHKARGLVHQFRNRQSIPCTLAHLCAKPSDAMAQSESTLHEWSHHPVIECKQIHHNGVCPALEAKRN